MRKVQFSFVASATLCAAFLVNLSAQSEAIQEKPKPVSFFDVLDLPARIDEPKLFKAKDGYSLNCAVANRSGESFFGLRLILMIVDPDGKLRARVTWAEESELPAYSIKTFHFNLRLKEKVRENDRYFLAVDEVIGRETIWRAVDADKVLRAYARGQNDLTPAVRVVANKDDREPKARAIPQKWKAPEEKE